MFNDLVNRDLTVTEWVKIPWHDPEFSRRMLAEHVTQDHDLASRRLHIIDQHVAWIHSNVLKQQSSRILDLGCGPGFYMHRLENLGHTCTGIDISPASIAYAQEHHAGQYILGNVIDQDYGTGYDLVSMIFGELNAFSPEQARTIIEKAYNALNPGGTLLLEVTHEQVIMEMGQNPPAWHTAKQGLFSDEPYIMLMENRLEDRRAISFFYIIDAQTGALSRYVGMHHAYSDDDYRQLVHRFQHIAFFPALTGTDEASPHFVIVARK